MGRPATGELAKVVVARATEAGLLLATAESCTGGLIAGAITDVAGSSVVFDRGFVTYSNEAKQDMLGVKAETLEMHGAVSRRTAQEMAEGALALSKTDIAVSVTGIAGPGGGSPEKPVGLVFMAVARTGRKTVVTELRLGDIGRDGVRTDTVRAALDALIAAIS